MKKKKCSLPYQYTKDIAALKLSHCSGLKVSPEGTQGGNRMSGVMPSAVAPPPRAHSGETHDGKNAGYWPQIVEVLPKE